MALVMFGRHGWRRIEMALVIAPAAHRHMRRLVAMAQLTLGAMAETHLIIASIHPANRAGQRMAAMVGFRPSRLKTPGFWVFGRNEHGCDPRRRQRGQT